MSDPTVLRTKVDLPGLMKVLGENLYSTPNVALRELVQNAHDSCHRRRIEDSAAFEPAITVRANPGDNTLSIEDNGAGLTRDEIIRYLATIGSGYTRGLRDGGASAGLIGYFGLGFLSAFVVSDKVEVHTCSYQEPDRAWLFSSRGAQSYAVGEAAARPIGTEVRLHLSGNFADLADTEVLQTLLARYCCLLTFPIRCGGVVVNAEPAPWREAHSRSPLRHKTLSLAFAQRFEPRFAPLFTVDVGGPDAPCRGMIWIQDAGTYGTSDNRNVWVFVRGMMVTDEDRDLLPPWAGFAGAVVESEALTPTASRESLQRNADYRACAETVRDSLVAGLAQTARSDPESWTRFLLRHNEALLGAAISDDRLFDLVRDDVTVPTSQGDLTVPRLLELAGGKIHVTQGDGSGFEEILFRALKVPVVRGTRYAALPFCKLYTERRRGALVILGTGRGDDALFQEEAPEPERDGRLARWFAGHDVEVVPSRYAPEHLPLVLVPDRDVELKRRIEADETRERIATAALSLARSFTETIADGAAARLYVNLSCPAIQALLAAPEARADLGVRLLRAFSSVTAEPDQQGKLMEVDEALESLCGAIVEVVQIG